MELRGRTALVTGAARRVGRAIALAMADRGADLVIHYKSSESEAHETVEAVERLGRRAFAIRADLAEPAEVEELADRAVQTFGRIDVLINNAALYHRTFLETLALADWEQFLRINLTGPFLLSQRLGLLMRRQGGGKIVNVVDIMGMKPWADFLPYGVSKGALIALTQGLAKALAPEVQINAVAPGAVLLTEAEGEKEREAIARSTLLKRMGDPTDVAKTVLFLLEGSDFITGQVVVVDGGRSLK
ncbi:SDR family oxidoreductase [Candidatus Methylomirabilis sp.]|uniref:SDR family NAD(P)-dependent oxidoreductase n=1 Tax=Candidatus Methylomirabilis sp. TaxID=2032687 RepID=UPI002A5B6B0F|nr:SDR family oxidoreductase [Candidatus Methylomirabilis sp.]